MKRGSLVERHVVVSTMLGAGQRVLGMVTEPANGKGRSYDYWMAEENVIAEREQFPEKTLAMPAEIDTMTNIADEL